MYFPFLFALAVATPADTSQKNSRPVVTSSVRSDADKQQVIEFSQALLLLHKQSSATFIAEGAPVTRALPQKAIEDILHSPSNAASSAAVRIAGLFDYEAKPIRGGRLYLLRKKYTSSYEVPEVTLEEWNAAFADIQRLFSAFNPRLNALSNARSDPSLISLLNFVLDNPQGADGKRELPVGSLPKALQSASQQLGLCTYIQMWEVDLNAEVRVMNRFSRSGSGFTLRQASPRQFGLEYPSDPEPNATRQIFVSLSKVEDLRDFGYVGYQAPSAVPVFLKPDDDPTVLDKKPASLPEPALPSKTLRKFAEELNARPGTRMRFAVDDALADKRVTVVGADDNQDPFVLWESIASLYGLRVEECKESDGTTTARMQRPRIPIPQNVSDLPAALLAALPAPYTRSLQFGAEAQWKLARERMQEHAMAGLPRPGEAEEKRSKMVEQYFAARQAGQEALERQRNETLGTGLKLRVGAVRQLRTEIEPILDAPNGPPQVAVSDISPAAKKALACYLFSGVWFPLRELIIRPVPPYVTNPGAAFLIGSTYQDAGKDRYRIGLEYFDPTSGTRKTALLENLRR